jgi:hypothetical protein
LPGGTGKNHEKPVRIVSQQRFKPSIPGIQVQSSTTMRTHLVQDMTYKISLLKTNKKRDIGHEVQYKNAMEQTNDMQW